MLRSGDWRRWRRAREIEGPAIVESSFTTIVLNPGASAERSASGSLVIVPDAREPVARAGGLGGDAELMATGRSSRDVVALAVMTNRMEGVVRKMTNTLFRTARSSLLEHRARFLLLRGDRRARAARDGRVAADPRDARPGPDVALARALPPQTAPRRRLLAQLPLPRQLARGRSLRARRRSSTSMVASARRRSSRRTWRISATRKRRR